MPAHAIVANQLGDGFLALFGFAGESGLTNAVDGRDGRAAGIENRRGLEGWAQLGRTVGARPGDIVERLKITLPVGRHALRIALVIGVDHLDEIEVGTVGQLGGNSSHAVGVAAVVGAVELWVECGGCGIHELSCGRQFVWL